jgi:hypothetical protein
LRTRLAAVAAVFAAAACTTPDPAGLPSLVATSDIL